jgi:glycosyltransferase involved in cell wall biosynthesis
MRSRKELKEMAEKAHVSVIIPCYRCADTIGRAVASVAEQTLPPKEVVLVDDCSEDETLQELHRLQTTYPDGWIKIIILLQNAGPATARNKGWDAATEPFVAFLDSDDAWHPQKIELQYFWMQAHPKAVLTGHACRQINSDDSNTTLNYEMKQAKFKFVSKARLLISNRFPTPSVMLRRELSLRFQDGKRYCEDYLLWGEICCSGMTCYRSELPLAYLYKSSYGAGGLSGELRRMQEGEIDAYQRLYAKQCYGDGIFIFLTCLSWIKYFHRLFKVKLLGFGTS